MREIRRPKLLLTRGVRRVTKTVLFPVRFLFPATGDVGANDAAAAWDADLSMWGMAEILGEFI